MARKLAAALLFITWGLWFGGIAALFLFAAILATTDQTLFHESASHFFNVFNLYLIILGTIAILTAGLWRMFARTKSSILLFILFACAAVIAAAQSVAVAPKMEALRVRYQTNSPAFQSLHTLSLEIYSAQALVLLAAGLTLPKALEKP